MSHRSLSFQCLSVTAVVAALSVSSAEARFTWGGWLSRQFAVVEEGGVETLYVVSREDGDPGNPQGDDMNALWAFCADGDCTGHSNVVTDTSDPKYCERPCKWMHVTSSLQNEKMGAPIVVDESPGGHRVVFGTNAGKVHAYDDAGAELWEYPADAGTVIDDDTLKNGFYARVAELDDVIYAVSWGNSGNDVQSHLHAMNIADGTSVSGYPYKLSGHFQSLFNIIPDSGRDRLYVGFEKGNGAGDKKFLAAVGLGSGDCTTPPCIVWRAPFNDTGSSSGGARFGGVVHGDTLIANMNNGVAGIDLASSPASGTQDAVFAWSADPLFLKQTYRSVPFLSETGRAPSGVSDDTVYIGQRGGGPCGGAGKVYRIDPVAGTVIDAGLDGTVDDEPFFPRCGGSKIPNVSFSSPVVSPRTGLIYLGGAKGNDPVYRIDPAYPQHNDDADATANHFDYSKKGWFDYGPPNGWRTDATFSDGGRMVHKGSAEGIVYGLDAEAGCGLVRWCLDTRTGQGGSCEDSADATGGCLTSGVVPCCDALKDDGAPTGLKCRRMAETCVSCWDSSENLLTDGCEGNQAAFALPFDKNTGVAITGDTIDYADIEPTHILNGEVVFSAGLDAGSAGTHERGEVLNVTTGDHFAFDYTNFFTAIVWVPLASGDNEIRAVVFGDHGNEYPVSIMITNAP